MILIIVGILIVVLVLYVIVSYNALVREKNKVKKIGHKLMLS